MAERDGETGFTLIEALVAMAILAVGAVALIGAAETHASRLAGMEDRVVGRWLAADAITARRLGLPVEDRIQALERDWSVELGEIPTEEPRLVRLDVVVAPAEGGPSVTLTGFAEVES